MTEEKFDGTIGRCASVVALLQMIPFVAETVIRYARGKVALAELLWHITGFSALAVFIVFLVCRFFSQHRKGQLDSAAKRATLLDYKYCSDVDATDIHHLLCNRYNIDIENLSSSDPVVIQKPAAGEGPYLSAEEFFSDKKIMGSFECVPLKNEDKKNKCILQVLYVPIDADGNVPVILRMPDQHSSAGEDEPRFTFVSFSPVPRRYEAKFDKFDWYRREVPSTPTTIDEYGTALSKQGSCYYLFYIFFARYDNLRFAKGEKMDRAVLERVFSVGDGKMFAKDHDEILHVTTFKNLYKAVTKQACDDDVLKQIVKKGKRKFVRLENGKPYITFWFDLSKAEFKGVEKKIVECEGRKSSCPM